jgi:choline-sulfatase
MNKPAAADTAKPSPTTAPTRPNVLVIMYDQISASALRCYGNPTTITPNIDRLAAEGVVFDNAYCNSPLCTPARYCLMTGQLPTQTGGYDNAAYLPSTVPTVAHYLRTAGYRTVLSGKMHFVGPDQLHGFEERRTTDIYPADFGWTPDWTNFDERIDWWYHNMSSVTGAGVAEVTNQLLYDDEVGNHAIRALHDAARADDGRPFFMVASFTHPHDPYVTRRQYWDLYEGVDIPLPRVGLAKEPHPHTQRLMHVSDMANTTITEDDMRRARRAYYGNVSYVDEWTGRLLATLDALQLRNDTVVILVADHGDLLGEHGLWYKMSFFEDAVRIPLVVHAPKRFAAGRVAAPVSLVDVLPTLAEMTGAPAPVQPLAGTSLVSLLATAATSSTAAATERMVVGEYMAEGSIAPVVMLRRGEWKFIHSPVDPDQLFHLASDPDEVQNLAADPRHAATLAVFREEVAARWNLDAVTQRVLASQRERHFITAALRNGRFTPWEYTPPRDGAQEYMRNHLDLNDVERMARWPR